MRQRWRWGFRKSLPRRGTGTRLRVMSCSGKESRSLRKVLDTCPQMAGAPARSQLWRSVGVDPLPMVEWGFQSEVPPCTDLSQFFAMCIGPAMHKSQVYQLPLNPRVQQLPLRRNDMNHFKRSQFNFYSYHFLPGSQHSKKGPHVSCISFEVPV